MRRLGVVVVVVAAVAGLSFRCFGQYGTAESGYFPAAYRGDTFKGTLVESTDHSIVLRFTKGTKTETFNGTLEGPCMAPLKAHPLQRKELHLSAIPLQTTLTAYYLDRAPKNAEKNAREGVVIAIRFDVLKGQEFVDPERPIIPCTGEAKLVFKGF